jgi:hypothetical protein
LFLALPPDYMASLHEQPGIVEQMIDYHTVLGRVTTNLLVGNQLLETELKPTKLKVSVFMNVSIVEILHNYRITAVLKVETDIIISIAESPIGRAEILGTKNF